MRYFFELLDGIEFVLGGVACRKLNGNAYCVVTTGQSVLVGNKRFRVRLV